MPFHFPFNLLALLLWTAPLCLCGCRKAAPVTGPDFEATPKRSCTLSLKAPYAPPSGFPTDTLDIFAYDPANAYHIDSYSRIARGEQIQLTLTTGPKRLVILSGMDPERLSYNDIVSLDQLKECCGHLEEEDPEHPLLSGTADLDAGVNPHAEVCLTPLLTRIRIAHLAADFRDRSYAGAVVDSVSIYLTNVNCRCPLLGEDDIRAEQFCNCGRWSEEDMQGFASPSMLHTSVEGPIGPAPRAIGAVLYCYPNQNPREELGSPCTRIVVECRIDGERFYYPITIGYGNWQADGLAAGIARGKTYDIDITLRHLGSRDPDTVVAFDSAGIFIIKEDWEDLDEKYERF